MLYLLQQHKQCGSPPYFPLQLTSDNVGAFFVIGILMMIPTVANQVKQSIIGESGANIGMGGAIFGGLSGATALGLQAFNMWRSETHNRSLQSAIAGQKGEAQEQHKK